MTEGDSVRDEGNHAAGVAVMTRLFGRKPDRAYIPEEFFENTVERVYGELWGRPGLTIEERSMITVAVLAAQGKSFELGLHIRGAKNLGYSRQKLEEMMTHIAHYCGWPTALQGFKCIDQAFAPKDSSRG